jgi:hypothetical protein
MRPRFFKRQLPKQTPRVACSPAERRSRSSFCGSISSPRHPSHGPMCVVLGHNRTTDMSSRDDILRSGITKNDKIIEIGPSYNPLTPKTDGWRSHVLDHTGKAGLVEKYRNDPSVDVTKIENVDFVWADGPLSGAVPAEHHGTFDVLVASHVFEHIPDLIGTLRSAEVPVRCKDGSRTAGQAGVFRLFPPALDDWGCP